MIIDQHRLAGTLAYAAGGFLREGVMLWWGINRWRIDSSSCPDQRATSRAMCEPEDTQPWANEEVINKIVDAWKAQPELVTTASKGFMCLIGKMQDLDRAEVNINKNVLAPVIEHLGPSNKLRSVPRCLKSQAEPQASDQLLVIFTKGVKASCTTAGPVGRSSCHVGISVSITQFDT